MRTSSCKQKGRKFQQAVRDLLRTLGEPYGLVDDDIKSTSMGVSGVDVTLSPAAKNVFTDIAVECKNVESINLCSTFWEHAEKYPNRMAVLFHKKNRTEPTVTMKMTDFTCFMRAWLLLRLEL